MAINFSHLNIFTNNKNKMVNFLTQLFDVELSESHFNIAGANVDLVELPELSGQYFSGPLINLLVETTDELEMIAQKANFYYYRTPDLTDEQKIEGCRVVKSSESTPCSIMVIDPDNRYWSISCPTSTEVH